MLAVLSVWRVARAHQAGVGGKATSSRGGGDSPDNGGRNKFVLLIVVDLLVEAGLLDGVELVVVPPQVQAIGDKGLVLDQINAWGRVKRGRRCGMGRDEWSGRGGEESGLDEQRCSAPLHPRPLDRYSQPQMLASVVALNAKLRETSPSSIVGGSWLRMHVMHRSRRDWEVMEAHLPTAQL